MSKKNLTSGTPVDNFRIVGTPTRFTTSANYTLDFDVDGIVEHPRGESLTVPMQSYTIHELFQRYSSGNLPEIAHNDTYYETDVFDPNAYDHIDPTDRPDFDLADYHRLTDDINSRKNSSRSEKDPKESEDNESKDNGDTRSMDQSQSTTD